MTHSWTFMLFNDGGCPQTIQLLFFKGVDALRSLRRIKRLKKFISYRNSSSSVS